MDVHYSPEQETLLSQLANQRGTDAKELVKDAALRLLEENDRFRAAVREGVAAADRGQFVEHAEVWANIENILRS